MRLLAAKRRVEMDQVEAVVQAGLNNPLTYLGVVGEKKVDPGLERVQVKVYVSFIEPAESLDGVWNEMIERSPLIRTFRSVLDFELSLSVAI